MKYVQLEHNRRIPFAEWRGREYKKLQIRAQLAQTVEELDAIQKEIRQLKAVDELLNNNEAAGGCYEVR